ncbi:MAG: heavy metal-associated domain-containing protein [Campylobacterales bacterium]|nr:heavy metal-associated domain-containing protein [Campylobacterales bacterium]
MKAIFLILCAVSLFALEGVVELKIKGMTCPTCTRAVKLSLLSTDGVKEAAVYLKSEKAVVTLSKNIPFETLEKAVKNAGYTAELIK